MRSEHLKCRPSQRLNNIKEGKLNEKIINRNSGSGNSYAHLTDARICRGQKHQRDKHYRRSSKGGRIWLNADEILEPFKGTFAEGKEYGVEVDMSVEEAYELSETDLKITVNGKSVSGTIGDNSISVFSSVKAVSDKKDSTPDSASTADSATSDSATTDGANNANGSIPTNEGNGTFVLFGVVIGIVAVAGVAYFIYIKKNK